jgi:hypothetical protein
VAPLHGTTAADDDTSAASRKLNLCKAAPIGNDGEAVDDLNQGGVIGG